MTKLSSGYLTPKSQSNALGCACPDHPEQDLPNTTDPDAASREWAALAPLIAGRDTVRVSRNGGKSYLDRWVRPLTETLPTQPAAVHLHNAYGCAEVLVLDLDVTRGDVAVDHQRLCTLLGDAGVHHVSDYSPSGGRHIYVPLDRARPHRELYGAALGLQSLFPSVDASPHASADTGCIRAPGSVWKRGGYQRLIGDLTVAVKTFVRGNSSHAIDSFFRAIPAASQHSAPTDDDSVTVEIPVEVIPPTTAVLSPRIDAIARQGIYDTGRYRSPSEARMAVMTAAVRAGLDATGIIRRISTGIWPGLAALYTEKYGQRWRASALRDHAKAVTFCKSQPPASTKGGQTVQISTTSPSVTGGRPSPTLLDEHRHLREIETYLHAVELSRYPGTGGFPYRLLLRGLLAAAHQDGSRFIARGNRSLALVTGLHAPKISTYLRALCAEDNPFIRKIKDASGTHADVYELLLPETDARDSSLWSRGRPVHALRPTFRALGATAAFVYECLELSGTASITELSRRMGLSRTTLYDALATLDVHRLVRRDDDGNWSTTGAQHLHDAAEMLGCRTVITGLMKRFREERRQWHLWLAARKQAHRQGEYMAWDDPSYLWPTEPPPELVA